MKYVLMFASRPEVDAAVPPERAQEVYGQVYAWFEKNAGVISDSGYQLQPATTATTVKAADGDKPVVVDGPHSEAKEIIGGFSLIDVPDLDAAIELARTWPPLVFEGVAVEIRPIVEM